ncbi:MAG: hypothetical protein OEX02_04380 [Cyclobacteriaceae bacterium]|nr:hypothetical protein [Cyclobacteriaceae bacterium]
MTWIAQVFNKIWRLFHYYRFKGYYNYIGGNVLRIGFLYLLVIIGFVLVGKFLIDLNAVFDYAVSSYSDTMVLVSFFVSESILGLLPPDIFMMWAGKFSHPVVMLFILGTLSYIGGIVSYKIGERLSKTHKIKLLMERRLKKYIGLTHKWGGAFITIAALFPFSPYATVVLAVSILKYPYKKLLIFGLFRIARFVVQGMVLIKVLDIGI